MYTASYKSGGPRATFNVEDFRDGYAVPRRVFVPFFLPDFPGSDHGYGEGSKRGCRSRSAVDGQECCDGDDVLRDLQRKWDLPFPEPAPGTILRLQHSARIQTL